MRSPTGKKKELEDRIWQALSGADYSPWELIVFNYRKTFGLSYQEWLEEPLDIFTTNLIIMNIKAKFEKYMNDRLGAKSKKM